MLTKARLQMVRSLSDKAARREHGLFVAEGRKLVGEAVASGAQVESIYAVGEAAGEWPGAEAVTAKEMERMSHLKTPSDVLALVRIPEYGTLRGAFGDDLTLFLDGVQDPGNLGTIIRIADWFGIGDVVCSAESADCYNPKVVQATMGALFRVRVHYGDLERLADEAAARGVPVYGTFLDGENLGGARLSVGGIVVMGSEGRGVSPGMAARVDRRLFIPPYPPTRRGSESLNVAVATAIVCAEFRRRVAE